MIANNRLEKSFGPVGSVAGIFVFVAGLYATYTSFTGLILILIGAFLGFTSTSALIDYENKRVKLSTNIFGFIKTGHWISIDSDMKLGIKKSNRLWRAYSKSNQVLDISENDSMIVLYDSAGKQIIPLKKGDSIDELQLALESLSKQLGLDYRSYPAFKNPDTEAQ
jgi:hypothetical protein